MLELIQAFIDSEKTGDDFVALINGLLNKLFAFVLGKMD